MPPLRGCGWGWGLGGVGATREGAGCVKVVVVGNATCDLAAVIETARSTIPTALRRSRLRLGEAVKEVEEEVDLRCISDKQRNESVRRRVDISVRAVLVGRVLGENDESEQQKEVVRLRGIVVVVGFSAETVGRGCARDIEAHC